MKLAFLAFAFLVIQTPPLQFEVASVKVNKAGPMAPSRVSVGSGDRVNITNVTAKTLILVAYKLSQQNVIGGPTWLDADRFDIVAKAEQRSSTADLLLMLQQLLAERFKFSSHTEDRTASGYALVVARRDGKLGPNLHVVQSDCATLKATSPADPDPCGMRAMASSGVTGEVAVRGAELSTLLAVILRDTKRPVVDKTGLSGHFDFELKWTPQPFLQRTSIDRTRFPTIDPEGPSIFAALEEQLGLKLESERTVGTVLVIDAVERPTPD